MTRVTFEEWLEEELKDEEFRAEYERLEPGFEVAKLRTFRGLTQEELAQRVGTYQSSISRLESGEAEPSVSFLRRVVEALDGRLKIRAVPREHTTVIQEQETTADSGSSDVVFSFGGQDWIVADWTDQNLPADSPAPVGDKVPA